jgi:hypothetical protein
MLRTSLLAALAALVVAAPANAALKTATFKGTLSGTQVTTWSFSDPDDPSDPCDGASRADGSQTIAFKTKTLRVQVLKGKALFKRASFVPILEGQATIDREGDYTQLPSSYDEDACGKPVGDAGGEVEPPIKDCGTRDASISLTPGYEREPIDDVDGLTPLIPNGSLILDGELGAWLGYLECPYWIGGGNDGPSEESLLQSWEVFPEKKLFDKRRKSIVVSGDRTVNHRNPGFTGKTLIAWNLRLKRVG